MSTLEELTFDWVDINADLTHKSGQEQLIKSAKFEIKRRAIYTFIYSRSVSFFSLVYINLCEICVATARHFMVGQRHFMVVSFGNLINIVAK